MVFSVFFHTDLQAAVPAAFCPQCGGERYGPSLQCLRCLRRTA